MPPLTSGNLAADLAAFEEKFTLEEREAMMEYARAHPEHLRTLMGFERSEIGFPYLSLMDLADDELNSRLPQAFRSLTYFGASLHEVPIFALDTDAVIGACNSASESDLELDALELPPLPFETIAFEFAPSAILLRGEPGDPELMGGIVFEVEEGEEWSLMYLLRGEIDGDYACVRLNLRRGSMLQFIDSADQSWEKHSNVAIYNVAVQTMHLITARGVEHEKLPRPQRREFERKTKRKHPQAFIIKIGTTSAHGASDGSGRTLTCRFMVRGHWRHYETKKTWVRPYIKGPADAPWRAPLNPVRKVAA